MTASRGPSGPLDSGFEFLEAPLMVVEVGLLSEVNVEQRRQERILMVQQPACVAVLAGVLEKLVESRLIATP